jgi:hypothetical protein
MLSWGIVMTLMGLVQNYAGLLTARIFLGVTEAGLFPGVAVGHYAPCCALSSSTKASVRHTPLTPSFVVLSHHVVLSS